MVLESNGEESNKKVHLNVSYQRACEHWKSNVFASKYYNLCKPDPVDSEKYEQ